ncbi:MAG: hypothetical protein V1678_04925 [Candidatus Aenigmatarchaeota archaeon]
MKSEILIALLAIIIVSGCTGISGVPGLTTGNTGVSGSGLEITSFTAEPNVLYNASTVRIIMEVQNLGGSTVDNDNSKTFVYLTGSGIDVESGDNRYWHRIGTDSSTECEYFDHAMKPADVVRGTPGDNDMFKWSLRAPDIDKGQTRNDIFIGRVYTEYTTSVNGNVWAYTETESDAAKASGRAMNSASFTSTAGPVSVVASVIPNPVITYSGDRTFSLNIRISNAASGTIYAPGQITSCPPSSLDTEDLNKVTVEIDAPGFTSTDCQGIREEELISGKPTTVFCEMTINEASAPTTFKSYPIKISVRYGYFTEKTASVTIQGR